MGRRRGFFAELQHQQRMAEQLRRREYNAAVQAHNRAIREVERAQRQYERASAAAQRASAAERAALERAARAAHMDAQRAMAESSTAQALDAFEQIDSILAATLAVDDYVDIESLKQTAQHPPFSHGDLKSPLPVPKLEKPPAEPQFVPPPPPTGMSKVFGKKAHAEATAKAHAAWVAQHRQWANHAEQVLPVKNAELLEKYAAAKMERSELLATALDEYRSACAERERHVAETNASLDSFKNAFESGDAEALNQYVGLNPWKLRLSRGIPSGP
jgi:restriction system protein